MTAETGGDPQTLQAREAAVLAEIAATGTWVQSTEELTFGARVAWRNSNRCIGRLGWESLEVLDRRQVTEPRAMEAELRQYLAHATQGGRIRPTLLAFAPAHPETRQGPRILNGKLVRYAGYRPDTEGEIVGDPEEVAFTEQCQRLGWEGAGTPFDLLPVVFETPEHGLHWFQWREGEALEVELSHPDHPWFQALGLRWYAVPVVSNMTLEIGGVPYTAAPFNGWFMGTEIGSRNLGDESRYNLLPKIAAGLGLDTEDRARLWKDRALVELNTAVLHSYRAAGVTLVDHHTAARQFMSFCKREEGAGRPVEADWAWIVPPLSGSATPVFHQSWSNEVRLPGYLYRTPESDGG
jgi:nitric-oxide synthase, bacterial